MDFTCAMLDWLGADTPHLLLSTWTAVTQCWSDCEEISHIQGKRRSPRKMVRGARLRLETNPITFRDTQSSNTPGARQDPDTTQRLRQNCVSVSPEEVWVSSGLLWGQGLWVQQTWVWHKHSWGRTPLTPTQSHQNLHRSGETDSWRAKTESCVHQDPGERSSDPTRDWPRLPVSVQESVVEAWVSGGLLLGWGYWVQQCLHGTFWSRLPLSSLPLG